MEKAVRALEGLSGIIWGPAIFILLFGAGAFLLFSTGFFPFRRAGFIFRSTFGKILRNRRAFSAAATALGATVGTGNIIGVSSAVAVGGAGAVFWMWCGAFFGIMLKFSEGALAVKFRGGAPEYIGKILGRGFSAFWCICCVLASFGGGNMIQTFAAGKVFSDNFGVPPAATGALLAVLCGAVLFFGKDSVTRVSSLLVPAMAVIYSLGCFGVLFLFRAEIFPVFCEIISSAFEPAALGGGIFGIITSKALRTGISKGIFTHEAGMGSASLAHSESGGNDPLAQGCWGIVEVFTDIFVCSLTALVILCTKTPSAEEVFGNCFGFPGRIFLSVSMFLFALAAIIGWAFYGEKALFSLFGSGFAKSVYRISFCAAAVSGACTPLPIIWCITDIFNGLMVFPNLTAIIILSPEILSIAKKERPGGVP